MFKTYLNKTQYLKTQDSIPKKIYIQKAIYLFTSNLKQLKALLTLENDYLS